MEGILSGFRFASKKAAKEPKNSINKEGTVEPTVSTDTSPKDDQRSKQEISAKANQEQSKSTQPHSNRSKDMRLSKSTPPKTTNDDFDIPAEPVMPSYSSNPSSLSTVKTDSQAQRTPGAVIGPKISFKGELSGEEDLLIQGRVEGTIDLKGNQLTVGQQGVVKANLMAKTITIEGNVEGDLIGQESIEIKASSNVKGNLVAARVILEDGAKFRGSIDMDTSGKGLSSSSLKQTQSSSTSSSSTTSSSSEKA